MRSKPVTSVGSSITGRVSRPGLLVDERDQVALAGVLGSDAGEQLAEPLGFAGPVGQHPDTGEEVDRGPVAAVLLRVDLRGGRSLVDRDGVERVRALSAWARVSHACLLQPYTDAPSHAPVDLAFIQQELHQRRRRAAIEQRVPHTRLGVVGIEALEAGRSPGPGGCPHPRSRQGVNGTRRVMGAVRTPPTTDKKNN